MDDKNILVIDLTKNIGKTLMSSNGFTVDSLTVNRSSKTHYHKCYELELLLSGSAKIQINNVFYNFTKGKCNYGKIVTLKSQSGKADNKAEYCSNKTADKH